MRIYLICALIAVISAPSDAVINLSQHSFVAKEGFDFRIPEGWERLSESELRHLADVTNASIMDGPNVHYDYGFRLPGAAFPQIIISIISLGRVAESELRHMRRLERAISQATFFDPDIVSVQFGETFYDPESQILWSFSEGGFAGLPSARAVNAMLLTNTGLISIVGSSWAADFADHYPAFRAVIGSVRLPEHMQYMAVPASSFVSGDFDWDSIIGNAVGFGGIYLLLLLWKGIKSKFAKDNSG
jgi:hypothetical protein